MDTRPIRTSPSTVGLAVARFSTFGDYSLDSVDNDVDVGRPALYRATSVPLERTVTG